jgi:hypothetical protein
VGKSLACCPLFFRTPHDVPTANIAWCKTNRGKLGSIRFSVRSPLLIEPAQNNYCQDGQENWDAQSDNYIENERRNIIHMIHLS